MNTEPRSTVLVVDDDANVRFGLRINVEDAGYHVVEADNGESALRQLQQNDSIGLVISDIVMPKMNGVELLEQARDIRPELPFVMITGYSTAELTDKALFAGAYTVIVKPFDPAVLLAVVQRAAKLPLVLVVDSEAQLLAARLKRSHVRVAMVSSPGGAIEALQRENIDVVMIDRPGDGLEVTEALRREHPSLCIILVVSGEGREVMRNASKAGVFTCLQNPVDDLELVRVLATLRGSCTQP